MGEESIVLNIKRINDVTMHAQSCTSILECIEIVQLQLDQIAIDVNTMLTVTEAEHNGTIEEQHIIVNN